MQNNQLEQEGGLLEVGTDGERGVDWAFRRHNNLERHCTEHPYDQKPDRIKIIKITVPSYVADYLDNLQYKEIDYKNLLQDLAVHLVTYQNPIDNPLIRLVYASMQYDLKSIDSATNPVRLSIKQMRTQKLNLIRYIAYKDRESKKSERIKYLITKINRLLGKKSTDKKLLEQCNEVRELMAINPGWTLYDHQNLLQKTK